MYLDDNGVALYPVDTWEFDFKGMTWTKFQLSNIIEVPPPRTDAACASSADGQVHVMYGGAGDGPPFNDVWILDTVTRRWYQAITDNPDYKPTPCQQEDLECVGFTKPYPETAEPRLEKGAMVYSPLLDKFLMYGGRCLDIHVMTGITFLGNYAGDYATAKGSRLNTIQVRQDIIMNEKFWFYDYQKIAMDGIGMYRHGMVNVQDEFDVGLVLMQGGFVPQNGTSTQSGTLYGIRYDSYGNFEWKGKLPFPGLASRFGSRMIYNEQHNEVWFTVCNNRVQSFRP